MRASFLSSGGNDSVRGLHRGVSLWPLRKCLWGTRSHWPLTLPMANDLVPIGASIRVPVVGAGLYVPGGWRVGRGRGHWVRGGGYRGRGGWGNWVVLGVGWVFWACWRGGGLHWVGGLVVPSAGVKVLKEKLVHHGSSALLTDFGPSLAYGPMFLGPVVGHRKLAIFTDTGFIGTWSRMVLYFVWGELSIAMLADLYSMVFLDVILFVVYVHGARTLWTWFYVPSAVS